MDSRSLNQKITDIIKLFEDLIDTWNIVEAQKFIKDIEQTYWLFYNKLQKIVNIKNHWFVFETWHFEWINIDSVIKSFLDGLKEKFNTYVVNEVVILRSNLENFTPIYYYTLSINKLNEIHWENFDIEWLKDSFKKDLKFFVDNIIDKWLLEDWEWTLAGNNVWEAYDIILRVWDYIVWFNNTIESIEWLKIKYWIDQNELVKEVSKLYHQLKK